MMKTNRKPTHPGVVFKNNFIDEHNISISDVAKTIGMARNNLSRFINEHTKCTPELARKLAAYTGTGVAMWLNLQLNLDIWEAEKTPLPDIEQLKRA